MLLLFLNFWIILIFCHMRWTLVNLITLKSCILRLLRKGRVNVLIGQLDKLLLTVLEERECMEVVELWGHQVMVRWSCMVGGFNLTRGSILVTYLREINDTIFHKISSYSTKLQNTNIIQ